MTKQLERSRADAARKRVAYRLGSIEPFPPRLISWRSEVKWVYAADRLEARRLGEMMMAVEWVGWRAGNLDRAWSDLGCHHVRVGCFFASEGENMNLQFAVTNIHLHFSMIIGSPHLL